MKPSTDDDVVKRCEICGDWVIVGDFCKTCMKGITNRKEGKK